MMAKVMETQLEKFVISMTYCTNTYHNILTLKFPCVKKAYLCKNSAANHGGCFPLYFEIPTLRIQVLGPLEACCHLGTPALKTHFGQALRSFSSCLPWAWGDFW